PTSALGFITVSRLNGWPIRSPTDASPTSSRTPAHGSGATWIATPSSQWTLTTYSLPVSPGALTRVAACTLALSPIRGTLIEGFSHFVTSMTAPIASGWSDLPGGTCTHWKAPPLHGAHPVRTLGLIGRSASAGVNFATRWVVQGCYSSGHATHVLNGSHAAARVPYASGRRANRLAARGACAAAGNAGDRTPDRQFGVAAMKEAGLRVRRGNGWTVAAFTAVASAACALLALALGQDVNYDQQNYH